MVLSGPGTDGGVSGANGGGVAGVAAATLPNSGSSGIGAASDTGAAAFCGVTSVASGGGHIEWDGDEGLFAGAVFCAAIGAAIGFRGVHRAHCGYIAV